MDAFTFMVAPFAGEFVGVWTGQSQASVADGFLLRAKFRRSRERGFLIARLRHEPRDVPSRRGAAGGNQRHEIVAKFFQRKLATFRLMPVRLPLMPEYRSHPACRELMQPRLEARKGFSGAHELSTGENRAIQSGGRRCAHRPAAWLPLAHAR